MPFAHQCPEALLIAYKSILTQSGALLAPGSLRRRGMPDQAGQQQGGPYQGGNQAGNNSTDGPPGGAGGPDGWPRGAPPARPPARPPIRPPARLPGAPAATFTCQTPGAALLMPLLVLVPLRPVQPRPP